MLRVTEVRRTPGAVTMKVEGRIAGEAIAVLEAACRRILEEGSVVRLDLTDVDFVDRSGSETIRRLRNGRVVIAACPPVLRDFLEGGRR